MDIAHLIRNAGVHVQRSPWHLPFTCCRPASENALADPTLPEVSTNPIERHPEILSAIARDEA